MLNRFDFSITVRRLNGIGGYAQKGRWAEYDEGCCIFLVIRDEMDDYR